MTETEFWARRLAVIGKVRRIYRRRALGRPIVGGWTR